MKFFLTIAVDKLFSPLHLRGLQGAITGRIGYAQV
jgi:hypothetical protein